MKVTFERLPDERIIISIEALFFTKKITLSTDQTLALKDFFNGKVLKTSINIEQ